MLQYILGYVSPVTTLFSSYVLFRTSRGGSSRLMREVRPALLASNIPNHFCFSKNMIADVPGLSSSNVIFVMTGMRYSSHTLVA